MIKPISVLDNISKANKIKQRDNSQKSYIAQLPKDKADSFVSSSQVAFEGRNVKPTTPKQIYEQLNRNLEQAKNSYSKYKEDILPDKKWKRVGLAVITLIGSEIYASVKAKNKQEDSVLSALKNIEREQENEMQMYDRIIEENKAETAQIRKDIDAVADYFQKVDEIKRKQIDTTLFIPLLTQSNREGKTTIPNCVMVSAGDEATNELLIEVIKREAFANVVTIDEKRDILDYLEQAEEHYQNTKERTILHVTNFDNLIDPEVADASTIAGMKRIMGKCSKQYHTTILFSSTKPEQLDEIAMGPHRVKRISTDLCQPQIFRIEEAKARLAAENARVKKIGCDFEHYPISKTVPFLRDFLTVTGLEMKGVSIPDEPTKAEVEAVVSQIYDALATNLVDKLQNIDVKHTYEVKPETIYVKKDGKIEQFPGYRHIIKLDKDQIIEKLYKPNNILPSIDVEKGLEQSFITPNKHIEKLPLHVALYNYLNKNGQEPIETSIYKDCTSLGERSIATGTSLYIPSEDKNTNFAPIVINAEKKLFEKNADSYCTGNPVFDEIFTNPNTSPFSLKSYMNVDYQTTASYYGDTKCQEYAPGTSDFKYDLLHSVGDYTFALIKPHLQLSLNPNVMEQLAKFVDYEEIAAQTRLLDYIVCGHFMNEYQKNSRLNPVPKVDISAENVENLQKNSTKIFALDKPLTKEFIEKQELIDRLKDKQWCVESPTDALRDVLKLLNLNIKLSEVPSEQEMLNVLRTARNELIEKTKTDLMEIPKVNPVDGKTSGYRSSITDHPGYVQRYEFFAKNYFSPERKIPRVFMGLPALLLIADEHIAANPSGYLQGCLGKNIYNVDYAYSDALQVLAKELPSYELIKTASDALEGIARRPLWYYELGANTRRY